MKKLHLIYLSLLAVSLITYCPSSSPGDPPPAEDRAFITTWKTTLPSEMITIPTTGNGYNYTVNWGDGMDDTMTYTGDATHTYATADTYTVMITGTFPRIYFNNLGDKTKIQTVKQWGSGAWSSMAGAFYGASNLTVTAEDSPNLANVTSMQDMFRDATAFNQDISGWDTSGIQNMNSMFSGATAFNQDISSWNTAMVTDMASMFNSATAFNQNISMWMVNAVTACTDFAQNSGITNSNRPTFSVGACSPPTDVTTVKTIHAHVNNDVADGTTVVNLSASITVAEPTYSILEGNDANIFSIDSSTGVITIADASKITYDDTSGANNNNVHLLKVRASDGSDSSKITEAPLRIVVRGENGAFITTWTVGANETITIPTTGTGYDFTVDWGDSPSTTPTDHMDVAQGMPPAAVEYTYATAGTYTVSITGDFPRIYFNNTADDRTKILTVEQWGSTAWTSMAGAFYGASNLTVPAVDAPDLTDVTSMTSMFTNATSFNQDINHWDTSSIQDMTFMFQNALTFNQNIGDWNTAKVTDMNDMFSQAGAFNQDISDWNTGMVTNMNGMFQAAVRFNQNIGSWDTGEVTNMSLMFNSALTFNQDIGDWNTAKVTFMNGMFGGAIAFNQNISTSGNSWNTAMVTDMSGMFTNAPAFNQNISSWNTVNVTDMSRMFNGATAFNQNIRMWNVSKVTAATNCASFADSSVLINANWPTFMNAAAACNPTP